MNRTFQKSISYMSRVFGCSVIYSAKPFAKTLPYYFSKTYELYLVKLFDKEFYIVVGAANLEETPTNIKKRLNLLKNSIDTNHIIAYCTASIDWRVRQKLLKDNIPFIVPDMQLYLPFLGIAFLEKFNTNKTARKTLSPSAQYLLFELFNMTDVSFKSSYFNLYLSRMTTNRALNELYALGLLDKIKSDNSIEWRLKYIGKSLWEASTNYVFNPIQSIEYVLFTLPLAHIANLIPSGETALASLTMLGNPKIKNYAIYSKDWLKIKDDFQLVPFADEDCYILEIWKHKIPTSDGKIHPLALNLTMSDEVDERIQMSLEKAVNNYNWRISND